MACGVDGSLTFASDPNNNSTLSAIATLGGIRVRWTYPTVNPEALAFVKVFRSTSANFTTMTQIGTAKGDSYFDALDDANAGTQFYYWIQVVTINGSTLGLIGPASAVLSSSTSQYLAALSGQLEISSLNSQLQAEIAEISTNRESILSEGIIRSAIFDSVTLDLNALGIDVTQAFSAIVSEQTQRIDGDSVLASNISAVIASNAQNLAAIVAEQTARVSADTALAANVVTVEASVLTTQSNINATNQALGVVADDLDELDGALDNVPVLISAAVQTYDQAQVGFCMIDGNPNGVYGDKATCEANNGTWLDLKALATAVKGVQISDGEGTGSIEQRAAVYRDELNVLNANYTVKINANGAVGGFGIGLNSTTNSIDAIFDVGTFALRGASGGDQYPFAVSNGVTYIKSAVIEDLTIGTTKLGNGAVTDSKFTDSPTIITFTPGSGWNTTPPTFYYTTPDMEGIINTPTGVTGEVSVILTWEFSWMFKRKEGVGTVYGLSSDYNINMQPAVFNYRKVGNGAWSSVNMGDMYLTNTDLTCGGSVSHKRQLTLEDNALYEFRAQETLFGPLNAGFTNAFFDYGRLYNQNFIIELYKR